MIDQDRPRPADAATRTRTLPWSARWDRSSAPVLVLLGVVILLALLAGVLGALLARMTYERNPQFPLMYGPPDGIGPAQAKYVLTESIDRRPTSPP